MQLEEYLKFHPKSHLVFDFDATIATLVLPWPILGEKLNVEFRKLGPDVEAHCNTWNWGEYNVTIKKYGPNVRSIINNLYTEFENEYFKELKPNLELIEFIKNNHDIYTIYIWTNNQRSTIKKALKMLKIEKYIKKIVSASDVEFYKPDPVGFIQMLDKGDNKNNYLMIGDSAGDRAAAENAGIEFFLCSNSS